MAEDGLIKDLVRRMDGAIEVLRKEFGGLRTGRASASLLEPVTVPAYGSSMPLNQLANINVPEPRLITVQVWDRKTRKQTASCGVKGGGDVGRPRRQRPPARGEALPAPGRQSLLRL